MQQDVFQEYFGRSPAKERPVEISKDLWHKKELKENEIRTVEYDLDEKRFVDISAHIKQSLFFTHCLAEERKLSEQFLTLKFVRYFADSNDSTDTSNRKKNNALDDEELIEQILRSGVSADGSLFNLVGLSNSQLRSKTFCFFRGSAEECTYLQKQFIPHLENLEEQKGVPKRVKYFGLLFSDCDYIIDLPPDTKIEMNTIPDYEDEFKKHKFTDGCGTISLKLAREIYPTIDQKSKSQHPPSILQIRYCGHGAICKGVLVVDPTDTTTHRIRFRPSLQKVRDTPAQKHLQAKLGIVGMSRRSIGKMHKQVVALLSAHVPAERLLKIQESFLDTVRNGMISPLKAVECCAVQSEWHAIKSLVKRPIHGGKLAMAPFLRLHTVIEKACKDPAKISIPLADSRLLKGGAFPEELHDDLLEGQCLVFTDQGLHTGPVMVCRSPSYSVGDIRILEAVGLPEGHLLLPHGDQYCFRNCILFATQGQRPDPDKMSGGDLDGDDYLVIWDKRLLQYKSEISAEPAADYSFPKQKSSEAQLPKEDWISYVARWDNTMLARINGCFFRLASQYGVKSNECEELCKLFSSSVDQVSSNFRQRLRILQSQCLDSSRPDRQPVWEKMIRKQADVMSKVLPASESNWHLFRSKVGGTQSELLRLADVHFVVGSPCKLMSTELLDDVLALCRMYPVYFYQTPTSNCLNSVDQTLCTADHRCNKAKCKRQHSTPKQCVEKWMKETDDVFGDEIAKAEKQVKDAEKRLEPHKQKRQLLLDNIFMSENDLSQSFLEFQDVRHRLDFVNLEMENIKQTFRIHTTAVKNNMLSPNGVGCLGSLVRSFVYSIRQVAEMIDMAWLVDFLFEQYCKEFKDFEIDLSRLRQEFDDNFRQPATDAENLREQQRLVSNKITTIEKKILRVRSALAGEQLEGLHHQIDLLIRARNDFVTWIAECRARISDLKLRLAGSEQRETYFGSLCALRNQLRDFTSRNGIWMFFNFCGNADDVQLLYDAVVRCRGGRPHTFVAGVSQLLQRFIHAFPNHQAETQRDRWGRYEVERVHDIIANIQRLIQTDIRNAKSLVTNDRIVREEIRKEEAKIKGFQKKHDKTKEDLDRFEEARSHQFCPKLYQLRMDELQEELDKVRGVDFAVDAIRREVEELFNLQTWESHEIRVWYNDRVKMTLSRAKGTVFGRGEKKALPVFAKRSEIHRALQTSDFLVLTADTGSGKSTQVPQYLADDLYHALSTPRSKFARGFCTQPRRQAARGVSKRVCEEYAVGEGIGGLVGFHIGSRGSVNNSNKKVKLETRIQYVTEGILLNKLNDPEGLKQYDFVIIDEAHERGVNTDLVLALAKKVAHRNAGPHQLKVVVMSASIDAGKFARYLSADDNNPCPIIHCDGFMYDVQELYCPVDLAEDGNNFTMDQIRNHCLQVLFEKIVDREEEGDVLIFLPGKRDIEECVAAINKKAEEEDQWVEAYPLYASLPQNEQDEALKPECRCWENSRKVICCTNVAETSLTIDGVRFVIDSGKAKILGYNHKLRIKMLTLQDISQASAKQRRGRAGRTNTGWCYRIYSQTHLVKRMEKFAEPMIRTEPAETFILKALDLGYHDVSELDLLEPPEQHAVADALRRLQHLHFIESKKTCSGREFHFTKDGKIYHKCLLQFSPESARMIMKSQDLGCARDALRLAALLEASMDGGIFEKAEKKKSKTRENKHGIKNVEHQEDSSAVNSDDDSRPRVQAKMLEHAHQLGDHFTLLSLLQKYDDFEELQNRKFGAEERRLVDIRGGAKGSGRNRGKRSIKMVSNSMEDWCKQNRLQYNVFRDVQKIFEEAYDAMKRAKQWRGNVNGSLNVEKLLQAIVAGHFHNIAIPNDKDYFEAGYSLITPSSNDDGEIQLVKCVIGREAILNVLGDQARHSWLIYGSLFQAQKSGDVFMSSACRIKPEHVRDYADSVWKEYVEFDDRNLCCNLVVQDGFSFVGPDIYKPALLSRESVEGQQNVQELEEVDINIEVDGEGMVQEAEDVPSPIGVLILRRIQKESNAKILLFNIKTHGKSSVGVYGSKYEVEKARVLIETEFEQRRKYFLDKQERYHQRGADKGEICCILLPGLIVKSECNASAGAVDWNDHQPCSLVFFKNRNSQAGEAQIKAVVSRYRLNSLVKGIRSNPKGTTFFVDLKSGDAAKKLQGSTILAQYFRCEMNTKNRIENIPNFNKYRQDLENIGNLQIRGFAVELGSDEVVAEVEEVLDSTVVSDINFVSIDYRKHPSYVEQHLKRWKEQLQNQFGKKVYVHWAMSPRPQLEIDGAPEHRQEAEEFIQSIISQFTNSLHTKTFSVERKDTIKVLKEWYVLRKKHERVVFDLSLPRPREQRVPSVALSGQKKKVDNAWRALEQIVRRPIEDAGEVACVRCQIKFPLFSEKNGFPNAGQSFQLTMCGCVYCATCLTVVATEHLQNRSGELRCIVDDCSGIILPRDLHRNLEFQERDSIFCLAYEQHLLKSSHGARVTNCSKCNFKIVYETKSHIRCPKCDCIFCPLCGKKATRESQQHHKCIDSQEYVGA